MDVFDIVPELKYLKKNHRCEDKLGWSEVMSAVLKELHEKGKTKEVIRQCILKIDFVEGMKELLDAFVQKSSEDGLGIDIIIISHSNSYFIDILLSRENLKSYFKEIHTYPAAWTGDILKVNKYHDVPCKLGLCPKDFCKGLCEILE